MLKSFERKFIFSSAQTLAWKRFFADHDFAEKKVRVSELSSRQNGRLWKNRLGLKILGSRQNKQKKISQHEIQENSRSQQFFCLASKSLKSRKKSIEKFLSQQKSEKIWASKNVFDPSMGFKELWSLRVGDDDDDNDDDVDDVNDVQTLVWAWTCEAELLKNSRFPLNEPKTF